MKDPHAATHQPGDAKLAVPSRKLWLPRAGWCSGCIPFCGRHTHHHDEQAEGTADGKSPSTAYVSTAKLTTQAAVPAPCHSTTFSSSSSPTALQRPPVGYAMQGSLPTFLDIGQSFSASAITEDNLLQQLLARNKTLVGHAPGASGSELEARHAPGPALPTVLSWREVQQ